jgi:hypothetical protein
MIIGFAHVAYSTPDMESAIRYWTKRGWTSINEHFDISSSSEKWVYTHGKPTKHDIAILRGKPKIEILRHNSQIAAGVSRIKICDGYISLDVSDLVSEKSFFIDAIGFTSKNDVDLAIMRSVPSWNLNIKLILSETKLEDNRLNIEGLSCLAFVSNDIHRDRQCLLNGGAREISQVFETQLDGNRFKVVMCRTPNGNMLELFEVSSDHD